MDIEIRTAKYEDIEKIVEYRMDFLYEISGNKMTDEYRESIVKYFTNNINSDSMLCYLAVEDGKIISTVVTCIYYVIPKMDNSTGKIGYVFNVYTLKEYRGRGISEQLMRKMIEHAKIIGIKELGLNSEIEAISLYKRLGFNCVDREMVLMLD